METVKQQMTETGTQVDPSKIMQVGLGFWAAKTLLAAVKFELFTLLANGAMSGVEIKNKLGLHERSLYDFLDTLVALGFLKRSGLKETAMYSNAPDTDMFLDKNKKTYLGGMLEMANNRLYTFWNTLEEGLVTGKPQNESKTGTKPLFEQLYEDKDRTREFLAAMGGIQMGNFMAFARQFDFSRYNTLCDLGGAGGYLSAQVAFNNPHVSCTTFDLSVVEDITRENLDKMGVADKVSVLSGDFFKDEFPEADIYTMGNILHDWGLQQKKFLIKKAYDALPEGGALVVIEGIIDDDRRNNAFGLMMSLNMLIETDEGFDFSGADFAEWALEAGFRKTAMLPLMGPSSAAIAYK